MAVFRKKDQNIRFDIPDIGDVFISSSGDIRNPKERVFRRTPTGFISSDDALPELKRKGISIKKFNIGDFFSALQAKGIDTSNPTAAGKEGTFFQKFNPAGSNIDIAENLATKRFLAAAKNQGVPLAKADLSGFPGFGAKQALLPSQTQTSYRVSPGDNLSKIAGKFGISLPQLLEANPQFKNRDINLIFPNEQINIPRIPGAGGAGSPIDNEKDKTAIQEVLDNISLAGTDERGKTRKSFEFFKGLFGGLSQEKKPEAPSFEEKFAEKKAELGIDPLETKLADIDSQIEQINANLLIESEKAGEKLVPLGVISRKRGALQQEAEQRIALLNVERNAVARQLGNKLNTLEMIMNFTDKDFQNAKDDYEFEYNKNIQLFNIFRDQQKEKFSEENRLRDDARASLNILRDSLEKGNLKFSDLSDTQQQKIQQFELQAYGVSGILDLIEPQEKELTTFTDEKGNQTVVFYNPGTGTTRKIIIGKKLDTEKNKQANKQAERKQVDEFIRDNAADSFENIRLGIINNTEFLTLTEIDAILDSKGIIKEQIFLSEDQANKLARGLVEQLGVSGALNLIENSGKVKRVDPKTKKSKLVNLSFRQRNEVIKFILKEFQSKREKAEKEKTGAFQGQRKGILNR